MASPSYCSFLKSSLAIVEQGGCGNSSFLVPLKFSGVKPGGDLNMSKNNYHRAFGVYGIYVEDGKLLVINKNGGPYINRFDLPGGSLEKGEALSKP